MQKKLFLLSSFIFLLTSCNNPQGYVITHMDIELGHRVEFFNTNGELLTNDDLLAESRYIYPLEGNIKAEFDYPSVIPYEVTKQNGRGIIKLAHNLETLYVGIVPLERGFTQSNLSVVSQKTHPGILRIKITSPECLQEPSKCVALFDENDLMSYVEDSASKTLKRYSSIKLISRFEAVALVPEEVEVVCEAIRNEDYNSIVSANCESTLRFVVGGGELDCSYEGWQYGCH